MKTRCPNCSTLYEIREEAIASADGLARCYRCDTVFNAFENKLKDSPPTLSDSDIIETPIDKDSRQAELPFDASTEPNESTEEDSGFLDSHPIEEDSDLNNYEQDSVFLLADHLEIVGAANDDEPPYAAPEEPSPFEIYEEDVKRRIAEIKEQHTSSQEQTIDSEFTEVDITTDTTSTEAIYPEPEEPATEEISLKTEPSAGITAIEESLKQQLDTPEKTLAARIAETAFAAVLGIILLFQIGNSQKDTFKYTAVGQIVCSWIDGDCTKPIQRAPEAFKVLHRHIVPDPNVPDVLAMNLSILNQADFAQPHPDIQLALYDIQDELVARRRISPQEYLIPPPATDALIQPKQKLNLDLVFEDPGVHVTGFRINFL